MSSKRKSAREVAGVMTPETSFVWQVTHIDPDLGAGKPQTYYGFGEVRQLGFLANSSSKGLLAVMEGTEGDKQIRWFVYDLEYPGAIEEFCRYWRDAYNEYPIYRKMTFELSGGI